ncbi:unnamed protein product [Gadus morhua 'NCC']
MVRGAWEPGLGSANQQPGILRRKQGAGAYSPSDEPPPAGIKSTPTAAETQGHRGDKGDVFVVALLWGPQRLGPRIGPWGPEYGRVSVTCSGPAEQQKQPGYRGPRAATSTPEVLRALSRVPSRFTARSTEDRPVQASTCAAAAAPPARPRPPGSGVWWWSTGVWRLRCWKLCSGNRCNHYC